MARIYSGDALVALKVDMAKFNKQLAANLAKIKGEIKPKLRKIAMIYLRGVMRRTPVDTGRARAGWHVEDRGSNAVAVVNRVHYIVYLEAGHSSQAPNGMARLALLDISTRMKGII